jgi:hypothetical protein
MHIHVDSAKTSRGTLRPMKLQFNGHDIGVAEIIEEWPDGDQRFFNVKDADENIYLLSHADSDGSWDLVCFNSKRWLQLFLQSGPASVPTRHRSKGNGRLN